MIGQAQLLCPGLGQRKEVVVPGEAPRVTRPKSVRRVKSPAVSTWRYTSND